MPDDALGTAAAAYLAAPGEPARIAAGLRLLCLLRREGLAEGWHGGVCYRVDARGPGVVRVTETGVSNVGR
jgi:hypothetical protein